jgi:hypothetical protein
LGIENFQGELDVSQNFPFRCVHLMMLVPGGDHLREVAEHIAAVVGSNCDSTENGSRYSIDQKSARIRSGAP